MEKDQEVPLILGRLLLATGDAWIGVKDKTIVFNINGEQVVFYVNHALKHPQEIQKYCRIDFVEQCVQHNLVREEA